MNANVQNAVKPLVIFQMPVEKINLIPDKGLEPFWLNGEKWVAHEGLAIRFHEASPRVQRKIVSLFWGDERSQKYFDKIGFKGFQSRFERWYKCVVGGLDDEPDVDVKGNLTPDAYNNMCQDYTCPDRGKLCGLRSKLKREDVEVIQLIQEGLTVSQSASKLCLSNAAIKSRIEKAKVKLNSKTAAELSARAAMLGLNASPRTKANKSDGSN